MDEEVGKRRLERGEFILKESLLHLRNAIRSLFSSFSGTNDEDKAAEKNAQREPPSTPTETTETKNEMPERAHFNCIIHGIQSLVVFSFVSFFIGFKRRTNYKAKWNIFQAAAFMAAFMVNCMCWASHAGWATLNDGERMQCALAFRMNENFIFRIALMSRCGKAYQHRSASQSTDERIFNKIRWMTWIAANDWEYLNDNNPRRSQTVLSDAAMNGKWANFSILTNYPTVFKSMNSIQSRWIVDVETTNPDSIVVNASSEGWVRCDSNDRCFGLFKWPNCDWLSQSFDCSNSLADQQLKRLSNEPHRNHFDWLAFNCDLNWFHVLIQRLRLCRLRRPIWPIVKPKR